MLPDRSDRHPEHETGGGRALSGPVKMPIPQVVRSAGRLALAVVPLWLMWSLATSPSLATKLSSALVGVPSSSRKLSRADAKPAFVRPRIGGKGQGRVCADGRHPLGCRRP